jgi:predicted AAA+ superfamily ATPase
MPKDCVCSPSGRNQIAARSQSGISRTANIENVNSESLQKLRLAINEGSRVQRGGADPISYIDVSNSLIDVAARQNHAIFGRRGCGKTLLLHDSGKKLPADIRTVHLNCEDFKKHSFPNVLIEILDALFARLESELAASCQTN